jgi:hypothetical protein
MQEQRACRHVVVSETETTRPVERLAVTPVAKLLSPSEGAAHPLLEPAAPPRPLFAHPLDAENNLRGLAVAGADMSRVEGDERIAQEEALARSMRPCSRGTEERAQSPEIRRKSIRLWNAVDQEGEVDGRQRRARSVKAQRQGAIGVAEDDVFVLGRSDNDACCGAMTGQGDVGWQTRGRPVASRLQDRRRRTAEPAKRSARSRQGRIDERGANPTWLTGGCCDRYE